MKVTKQYGVVLSTGSGDIILFAMSNKRKAIKLVNKYNDLYVLKLRQDCWYYVREV